MKQQERLQELLKLITNQLINWASAILLFFFKDLVGAGDGEGEAFLTVFEGAERRETLVGDSTIVASEAAAAAEEVLELFFVVVGTLEFFATAIFLIKKE